MQNSFSHHERIHHLQLLSSGFFGEVQGYGYWNNSEGIKSYPHILPPQYSLNNLYPSIRHDVLKYFERYNITWWRQYEDRYFPTGHLLSSQIHCLNHLFALRKDSEAVLSILRPLGEEIGVHFDKILPSFIDIQELYFDSRKKVSVPNSNFISFEFVCHNIDLLHENHEQRGAKCTSIDAMIYAQSDNEKWLIPIEWKYTETYSLKPLSNVSKRYCPLIGPQSRLAGWPALYSADPYYELARQTLLMEQLISHHPMIGKQSTEIIQQPLQADHFLHILVTPQLNKDMNAYATTFRDSLKKEAQPYFMIVSPETLLKPIANQYPELTDYLKIRYWD